MIIPVYKGKGERTECSNYRDISLLIVVRKIFAGILVDRVCKVTEGLVMMSKGVQCREGVCRSDLHLKEDR